MADAAGASPAGATAAAPPPSSFTPPASTLGPATELEPRRSQLPPSSCIDGSLEARQVAGVATLDVKGGMTEYPVVVCEGSGHGFSWAVGETQGRRKTMEDAHVVNLDIDGRGTALFAVFDGHSGREVSSFCAQHIVEEVVRSPCLAAGDLCGALRGALLALDERLLGEAARAELAGLAHKLSGGGSPPVHLYGMVDEQGRYAGPDAGSTAAVALVRGDTLAVAHAGDSRVVLSENGVAQALTEDHKPDTPAERERITNAGLFVGQRPGGVPRVGGSLAMSRAMGDVKFKDPSLPVERQAVTAAPDTTAVHLAPAPPPADPAEAGAGAGAPGCGSGGRLLVVACDGLWDVMSRQQVINFLELQLGRPPVGPLRPALTALLHEALRHDSRSKPTTDNVSVVLVRLPVGAPWGGA
ncbi:hypothetical protein HYH03_018610 [Edaphochlamys debaryana]|uniref:PPM-type phosphatase domain-containing protein n=1 Tax=Edaphochlamys debaryana TaxID=47281 RepID=A0A836BP67_9CHLO|nr:hypothetical protein HYH03_018610 [Edaphochlamys debaryana]|eukprot:KAG2482439.1 hypothetical protein HYH03_018610 [Edaphochlamys debaryana]